MASDLSTQPEDTPGVLKGELLLNGLHGDLVRAAAQLRSRPACCLSPALLGWAVRMLCILETYSRILAGRSCRRACHLNGLGGAFVGASIDFKAAHKQVQLARVYRGCLKH